MQGDEARISLPSGKAGGLYQRLTGVYSGKAAPVSYISANSKTLSTTALFGHIWILETERFTQAFGNKIDF